MLCFRCNKIMKNVMHFEQNKNNQYQECPKCHYKTKGKSLNFDEILKEEVKKYN